MKVHYIETNITDGFYTSNLSEILKIELQNIRTAVFRGVFIYSSNVIFQNTFLQHACITAIRGIRLKNTPPY